MREGEGRGQRERGKEEALEVLPLGLDLCLAFCKILGCWMTLGSIVDIALCRDHTRSDPCPHQ